MWFPKNNGLIFHLGEDLELWRKTMVNNSLVFNFEQLFSTINGFCKIYAALLK